METHGTGGTDRRLDTDAYRCAHTHIGGGHGGTGAPLAADSPCLVALLHGRPEGTGCGVGHGGDRPLCLAAALPWGDAVPPGCTSKEPKRSPANQPEPREAVIEGISAGHHVVAVLNDARRHFCCTVVHFAHQVQALPADVGTRGAVVRNQAGASRALLPSLPSADIPSYLSFSRVQ